jgi:4-amino-4-deoxy-L-arabinose transferase-like glycosyltransferase
MATQNTPTTALPAVAIWRRLWNKERLPPVVVAALLALFAIKGITSLTQESATWDETHYFGLGKYLLQHRRWDVYGSTLHPPLSYYIHSIPWLFVSTDPTVWKPAPTREDRAMADVPRGQALLASPANAGDRLLIWSRSMMVLTGVLLGWYVYLWSAALYGKWSATAALALYAFCPNILAHARLITPDIVITTFFFISAYYFWRLLRDNRTRDALAGGIALGLALLSKYTGVLLIPTCCVLAVFWGLRQKTWRAKNCLIFAAVGIALLAVGYCMDLEPYWAGIQFQQEHAAAGHSGFLLGERSTSGWWYYLLVAFCLKTPVALMILLVISMGLLIASLYKDIKTRRGVISEQGGTARDDRGAAPPRAGKRRGTTGPRSSPRALVPPTEQTPAAPAWFSAMFLLLPAAAVFGFFSLNHLSIGLRYVLPIYPFLFVLASGAARSLASNRLLAALLAALLLWHFGASYSTYPHYLAYFSELAGGPENGYKYLVDSNLDWGQDLKGLRAYMREHDIPRIALGYFGSDLPERYGIVYDWMPGTDSPPSVPRNPRLPLTGWFAVSATHLQGAYFQDRSVYAWLQRRQPAAKIGYSIFVYHLDSTGK